MENQVNTDDQNAQKIGQNPVSQPIQIPDNPKINYLAMIGVILVCFVVFGFGGYYLGKQSSQSQKYVNDGQNQVSSPSPTPDQTVNWKTYINNELGIELRYPLAWYIGTPNENPDTPNTPYTLKSPGKEENFVDAEVSIGSYVNQVTAKEKYEKIKLIDTGKTYREKYTETSEDASWNRTKIKNLQVGSYPAVMYTESVSFANAMEGNVIAPPVIVDINKNGKIFIISLTIYGAQADHQAYQLTFDQILSVLKFIN